MSHEDSDWQFAFSGDSSGVPKSLSDEETLLIKKMRAAATRLEDTRDVRFIAEVANVARLLEARGLSIEAIAEHAGLRPGALRDFRNLEHLGELSDRAETRFAGQVS